MRVEVEKWENERKVSGTRWRKFLGEDGVRARKKRKRKGQSNEKEGQEKEEEREKEDDYSDGSSRSSLPLLL